MIGIHYKYYLCLFLRNHIRHFTYSKINKMYKIDMHYTFYLCVLFSTTLIYLYEYKYICLIHHVFVVYDLKWNVVNDNWSSVVGLIIDSYLHRNITSFNQFPWRDKHVKGNRLPSKTR